MGNAHGMSGSFHCSADCAPVRKTGRTESRSAKQIILAGVREDFRAPRLKKFERNRLPTPEFFIFSFRSPVDLCSQFVSKISTHSDF
jgi:hypothetical protein